MITSGTILETAKARPVILFIRDPPLQFYLSCLLEKIQSLYMFVITKAHLSFYVVLRNFVVGFFVNFLMGFMYAVLCYIFPCFLSYLLYDWNKNWKFSDFDSMLLRLFIAWVENEKFIGIHEVKDCDTSIS